jgi:hypothetical protein
MNQESENRKRFEEWISDEPYSKPTDRFSDSAKAAWPGQYKDIAVQLAWEAWNESMAAMPNEKS